MHTPEKILGLVAAGLLAQGCCGAEKPAEVTEIEGDTAAQVAYVLHEETSGSDRPAEELARAPAKYGSTT